MCMCICNFSKKRPKVNKLKICIYVYTIICNIFNSITIKFPPSTYHISDPIQPSQTLTDTKQLCGIHTVILPVVEIGN